jgi:hypothetical protein
MHKLYDILPLLAALNGETEEGERKRRDGTENDKYKSNSKRVHKFTDLAIC